MISWNQVIFSQNLEKYDNIPLYPNYSTQMR